MVNIKKGIFFLNLVSLLMQESGKDMLSCQLCIYQTQVNDAVEVLRMCKSKLA